MDGILQALARHAREKGDDPCLCEGRFQLTFAEFDGATHQVAADLLDRVDGPGRCVAWIGAAGAARLVAHVAMQKAGLVFCAPSMSFDTAQVCEILRLAACELILTDETSNDAAEGLGFAPVVQMRFDPAASAEPVRIAIDPTAPSYRCFTSGSTGMPKVLTRSRAALEFFVDTAVRLQQIDGSARVGLVGNLWETAMFSGLQAGAYTACYDTAQRGATGLADWMRGEAITSVMLFPALYRELMATNTRLPDLRCIVLVGEPLARGDAEAHARLCAPDARLLNAYGAMEYPYLTAWERRASDPIDFDAMPMGRRITDSESRLVDEEGREMPGETTGEIEITSHSLPSGYIDNPELTNMRFGVLPDGRRTFRTGDMAYRDGQGVYHSMGRRDQQTKIRGYIVRPTEIEHLIADQPGVDGAVVTARAAANGIRRLVCYYIGEAESGDLSAGLNGKIPNYMIPSIWRRVTSFPKTHSGKVIRDDLPDPFEDAAVPDASAFQSQTERTLANLFRALLHTAEFGRDDDFFDLGGDSLQAMRLVLDVEKAFGRRVPFERLMLNGGSIAALGAFLDQKTSTGPSILKRGSGTETLVVLHTLGGHLSDYLEVIHALDPGFDVIGVNAGDLASGACQSNMEDMAAHALDVLEDVMRTCRPSALIGYSFGAPIAFETCRLMTTRGIEPPPLILIDPQTPWTDRLRWVRPTYRAVRDAALERSLKDLHPALRLLRSALGGKPRSLNDAHRSAWLRYIPEAQEISRGLIVRSDTDMSVTSQATWADLMSPNTDLAATDGDHRAMMRGANAAQVAQTIQKWVSA